jgi:hypothetical protein
MVVPASKFVVVLPYDALCCVLLLCCSFIFLLDSIQNERVFVIALIFRGLYATKVNLAPPRPLGLS